VTAKAGIFCTILVFWDGKVQNLLQVSRNLTLLCNALGEQYLKNKNIKFHPWPYS